MKTTNLVLVAFVATCLFAFVGTASATLITGAVTSSTAATDLYPASNASNGTYLGTSNSDCWISAGFGNDYFTSGGPIPVLTIDLGSDVSYNGFSFWGYLFERSLSNNGGECNSPSQMSMRFATAAEGTGGFGTSITYNPTFSPATNAQEDFTFGQWITARYVELTITDNFAWNPYAGSRVCFDEIQFAVPEPSTLALLATGLAGLLCYAWRKRK